MKKIDNKRVERILDLVKWFEEFQPKDLEQIERIILGLQYVDEEVVKNELRQDIYRTIKRTKLDENLKYDYKYINVIHRKDANERQGLK
ncbi:hypothetical protein LZ906_002035 [Paraclostridium ghonii]|uniref:hypothetical protein n=1 Tax=Paraclostridium ghonii TaxID=29358 RepID=UPI00202CF5AF|nr:hypothetical protein [Paeniclostridium ghonii]MCM0166253.1 hypothetical protein [Paeniclostridium ghonii]